MRRNRATSASPSSWAARSARMTSTRAPGWPAPRQSAQASPRCTTGATTSAGRLMPKPACEPSPSRGCAGGFPTVTPRGTRTTCQWTWAAWPGCTGTGIPAAAGQIAALAQAGLLGPDLQVVHANCATPAEIAQLAEAGATVSVSPFSEILIGYGLPRTAEFLAAGIPTGLSVDTTVLSGNADMFAIMKVTQGIANARAQDEFALTARRVLELATIEGARSLGMAAEIGSLTPGKRADLILVETGSPNLGVFTDPAHMLVTAAQP